CRNLSKTAAFLFRLQIARGSQLITESLPAFRFRIHANFRRAARFTPRRSRIVGARSLMVILRRSQSTLIKHRYFRLAVQAVEAKAQAPARDHPAHRVVEP